MPDRKVRFVSTRATVYELLNLITEQTGFMFIYDSNLLDNERKVSVRKGVYPLGEAIRRATGRDDLQLKVVNRHILLYRPSFSGEKKTATLAIAPEPPPLIIEGAVRDKESGSPLPYSSVGIHETGIGTIANQNGEFRLRIPDSLRQSHVFISHLGYEPQTIATSLLAGNHTDFYLQTRLVPLQEVIVRLVNPVGIIKEMLEKRTENCAAGPVYFTSFYREGIEKRKGIMSLTEAVFRVYKPDYRSEAQEQIKLLKMRKISNEQNKDTLVLKLKAGIRAALMLDLVKNVPDFLTLDHTNLYNYSKIDMSVVGSHLAHVIAFEQKEGVRTALYKGELYIDADNSALLSARFEINPAYISKATDLFVVRKSRGIKITPRKAAYTVTYKAWNGKYYVSHIRGDLNFRIRKKKQLFYSSVHTWFEMATCRIDTAGVRRFPRGESLPPNKVFSDTRFVYDGSFWDDFNIILPEEELNEAISRINSRIEESSE